MIVGSWTYSISNANAIKAYNTAAYFKKYGAVGSSLASHLGRDNGLYTTTIGYENYAHFGEVDDKLSNDENWAKDMEPFFSDTKWETNNFYEPLVHNMPSDAGIKPVFAQWMFYHKDINLIQDKGDIFIKAWMDNGATGGSVGSSFGFAVRFRMNGKDNGSFGFGVRFNTMKEYGLAQDKLNGDNFWSNHKDFLDEVEPRDVTMSLVNLEKFYSRN